MNFSEVVTAVVSLVKRPDKQVEVEMAVNATIAEAILKAEYPHDLVEAVIPLSPDVYTQTINLSTLASPLVRFRKWKYLKLPGIYGYLQPIDPENVFKPGQFMQNDCYYQIGSNLTIITSSLSDELLVGYYSRAPVLANAEEFWLLDMCPYAIVYKAAAIVFNGIGDTQAASTNKKSGDDLLKTMQNDMQYGYTI